MLQPAGDEVWLPLIDAKEKSSDMNSAQDMLELLALYERAEGDYLSIPLLKRHLEFIFSRYEAYATENNEKPEEFGEMFSIDWTRLNMTDVKKGTGHLTESHLLWDQLQEWESELLGSASAAERPALTMNLQALLLDRMKQPHSTSDNTFQVYSTFTTNYKPPEQYESLMVAASKSRSQAVKGFQRREAFETELKNSGYSLEAYSRYAFHERRAKNVDLLLMSTIYERAIAEGAKRRFHEEAGAESALRSFWCGYLDTLRVNNADETTQLNVVRRATRSVPGCGEVWARYIRFLESVDTQNLDLGNDNVPDIYVLQSDIEQIIPVVLARAGYEKRRIEGGTSDDETLTTGRPKLLNYPIRLLRLWSFLIGCDSVPAALTKDKKRIRGNEVAVHLAWQSTLYITKFPESADDPCIRKLFGKYETIFDVRWPSKKFKNTRRFCYLQYTSPTSAQSALELHELEPGLRMKVFISNPERRKERTDHDANEREIYVAGLNRSSTEYGSVEEVRLATDAKNQSKGFAFIEFEEMRDAQQALEANNQDLKNRRIAVTLADPRVKGRNAKFDKDTGPGEKAEAKNRSVRIRNLPSSTQEGLLQQAIEKVAPVKRLEVFADKNEALVELESIADAGKLLLRAEPLVFNGNTLSLSEEATSEQAQSSNTFVPRSAVSRPKAGLGHKRRMPVAISRDTQSQSDMQPTSNPASGGGTGKGQDDFRKMLEGK
ncbi:hypothetical protein E1B28_012240 [Marasmius oreades]|uniref:RRM domain-containing protein n=1 Tax=Marasmius oreades TaxID=181124 RepID=A0A9P7RRS8_9AGAR|nr:uncharacterized protein E1B28_012240 [Marasmius oreades]KAG7088223.1 hypothetical protein E1B28_012240 [Marasmius oreades]